jgi:ubiquitin C-terminal hydrolase
MVIHGLFKENIVEMLPIKEKIEEYIIEELSNANINNVVANAEATTSQPGTVKQAGEDDKDEKLYETIIHALVELEYTPAFFSAEFGKVVDTLWKKAQKEKEERDKRQREQERSNVGFQSMSTSSGYGSNYSSSGYTYRPEPTNMFPYKSQTGYVGLKNQGATCYLNSLIQALYHTPAFRRSILQWKYDPEVHKKESKCIPLQLQKLFANLRLSESKSVETKDLTESFGWTSREVFVQHDVQELLRVLFDSLSSSNLPINDLYEGTMRDYVICTECKRVGGRKDNFLDLQLVIQNAKHLDDALDNFQFEEILDGSNQYSCEKCNKKVDARKGLKILSLPDVLTLHLKRFDIDYNTMNRIKLNNEVIFPLTLDMNKHVKSSNSFESSDMDVASIDSKHNIYNLYAVLMHSGTVGGGHYYAYIRIKDKWYEFNDSTVSEIPESDVEKAFGGGSSYANGYMLMYVRQYPISEVHLKSLKLPDHEEESIIPQSIRDEILKENERYTTGQREYELKRAKIEYKVHYNGAEHTVALEKEKTVADLVQAALDAAFKGKDNKPAPTNARLRKYDAVRRIPTQPLDDLQQTIDQIDLRKEKKLLLETRTDEQTFNEYQSDKEFLVRVVKFENNAFQNQVEVYVPLQATLSQFKSQLETLLSITAEHQRIIMKVFTNVSQQEKILSGESKTLFELKVQAGETLYVEQSEGEVNDPTGSALLRALENQRYIMTIRYQLDRNMKATIPKTIETDRENRAVNKIDRRRTVGDLKELISQQISVNVNNFKLSKGPDDSAYAFNDTDEKLLQLVDGCTVYVKPGQQMSKQQFNVTFYFHEEKKKSAATEKPMSYGGNRKTDDDGYTLVKRSRDMDQTILPHHHVSPYHRGPDDMDYKYNTASQKGYNLRQFPPKRVKFEDEDDEDHWKYHYSSSANQSFKKLFDTVLGKNTTVREVKEMLIQKAKGENHELVTKDTTMDNIRLREKLHGRNYPGKILLDNENAYDALASSVTSSVPNREVIIQKVADPQRVTADDMVIRIARFRPSQWTLGRREEIIINKEITVQDLKNIIKDLKYSELRHDADVMDIGDDLDNQDLDVTKIPYQMAYQLKNNEFMSKLNWQDAKPDQIVTKAPWFLDDGDLILYKIPTEEDWFTLNNKTSKTEFVNGAAAASSKGAVITSLKVDSDGIAGAGQSSGNKTVTTGFNRERALRFYTDDEETDKKDKGKAEEPNKKDLKRPNEALETEGNGTEEGTPNKQ